MAPPSINVEFAPPSRTSSFDPAFNGDHDALSPPSSKLSSIVLFKPFFFNTE
jgi:hypothetical protein